MLASEWLLMKLCMEGRYQTPLYWYQDEEAVLVGPELLQQTTEKVKQIQKRMKASQSR